MDNKQEIATTMQFLEAGGNIIKTRDDRELVFVNQNGEVQNVVKNSGGKFLKERNKVCQYLKSILCMAEYRVVYFAV